MPDFDKDNLRDALVEALGTMAFVSAESPQTLSAPPGPALVTRISFNGSATGALELICPREFGVLLAANLMACPPELAALDPTTGDVLRELLNVTCGIMLRQSGIAARGIVEMGVPTQEPFDLASWEQLIADGAVVLDAEGHNLAVRAI
jgi:hypothetical protein